MNRFGLMVFVALAVLCFRGSAQAAPAVSGNRIAVGAGVSYDWYGGTVPSAFAKSSEPCANGFLAYNLSAAFSATGAVVYGASNKGVTIYPGVHYRLGVGAEDFAIAAAYAFYGGEGIPEPANEWVASLIYQHPLGKYAQVSGSETWGFDTKLARTSVQLSFPLFVGKDAN